MMFNWWPLSHAGKVSAVVVGILGGIVTVATAWPLIEPYMAATRGYTRAQIGGVQPTVTELMVWRLTDGRDKARSEAADWTIKLQKETDPQTRAMMQSRIDQLTQEQQAVNDRIEKLKGK